MKQQAIIGWDIGGAHVKATMIDAEGVIVRAMQLPCPLWQGLHQLRLALAKVAEQFDVNAVEHALTMTGELVDLFDNRWRGVEQIIATFVECFPGAEIAIYAGSDGFLKPAQVRFDHVLQIASANWLASASCLAEQQGSGLMVDIGSTTTDIILFEQAKVQNVGFSDYQRLCSQELIYTGIVRTPVMAVAQAIGFKGQSVGLMAEYFATMADVYRITGELDERHDQMPTADDGAKNRAGSIRRMARMIGCDVEDFDDSDWLQLAEQLKAAQVSQIKQACRQQLSRTDAEIQTLIGAGAGAFLVRQLADALAMNYQELTTLWPQRLPVGDIEIGVCAPAVAVALLLYHR